MFGISSGVDVWPADAKPVDVRYGVWDHSSCVWFCLCRPIETTLPTGVWDQQRSRCEARRCEARRCEARRCEARGRTAVPAPGGSYGVWDHSPCVWFCLCRPIETTLPTVVWDQQRRARSPGWAVPAAGHRGPGGLRTARARRDLSNAHYSMQVHTDLSKSMRRGLAMAPARFGSLWGLGPGALCLVLLAHANANDILDRAL